MKLFVLMVILAALPCVALASPVCIYDSLNTGLLANSIALGDGVPMYASFTAPTSYRLTNVDLNLARPEGEAGTGSISVYLFKNDFKTDLSQEPMPGGVLLGTLADSDVLTTANVYHLSVINGPELYATTRYWIGIVGSNNTTIHWTYSADCTGIGVEQEYVVRGQAVYRVGPHSELGFVQPFQMRIGDPAPEPNAGILAAIGFAAIGLGCRLTRALSRAARQR